MLTIVIIIVFIGIALLLMMRPRRTSETTLTPQQQYASPGYCGFGSAGAGGMLTGILLGYLLSQHLISPEQHDMWHNMNSDELRKTLAAHGILSESQFDALADQANAANLQNHSYAVADILGDMDQDFNAIDDFDGESFDV